MRVQFAAWHSLLLCQHKDLGMMGLALDAAEP